LFKLRLPNALPNLFTGIRISAGISVIGAITGELFAGSTRVGEGGLGYASSTRTARMETSYLLRSSLARQRSALRSFHGDVFWIWLALHNWHESSLSQVGD